MFHRALILLFVGGLFLTNCKVLFAQDSLESAGRIQDDSLAVKQLIAKSRTFYFNNPDSCLFYVQQALTLSRKIKFIPGETQSLNVAGEAYRFDGNFPSSLDMQFQALSLYRKLNDRRGEMSTLGFIGFTYVELMEYRQGLTYLLEGKKLSDQNFLPGTSNFLLSNIGHAYEKLSIPDSALYYQRAAYYIPGVETVPPLRALILRRLGVVYTQTGQYDSALIYYHMSLDHSKGPDASANLSHLYNSLADLHYRLKNYDSSFLFVKKAFSAENTFLQKQSILDASMMLSKLFREKGLADSALFYYDVGSRLKDELYGPGKFRQIQLLVLRQQQEQQKIIQQEQAFKSRIKTTTLLASLGVFIIIVLLLLRNNRHKQKAKIRIEKAYDELKAAQQLLIQSEKMASLGELTAGIAHEIQNPLNFVNNFSDVNKELIEELKIEKSKVKSERDEELEAQLLSDIEQNLEKINHHGKRAEAIVKGMLQHSKNNAGQKEPTDINALADEYLRVAYHGMRAKDKSFNATTKTDFDKSIGKINIVSQEIGRVILNLINNAFYAVDEKKKQILNARQNASVGQGYEPTVVVSTKMENGKVEIKIADNGNGISQKVMDKIFQPFFTTKPAGQGTGLGLSLAYDIVKAHGGEITVDSKEGEYTEFILRLSSKD